LKHFYYIHIVEIIRWSGSPVIYIYIPSKGPHWTL